MTETNLSSYNNDWYKPTIGASGLKQIIWYFTNVLFFINPLNFSSKLKIALLRVFGSKVGAGVIIKPGVNIKYPWKLKIGNHCWLGEGVWIDNLDSVIIGNNVCVSQEAMLLTGNHDYTASTFNLFIGKIHLEDGAWIGAKSIVCPGVHVASHAVLSVNSVATKNLESYSIYQGNPAKFVKKRTIN